MPDLGPVELVVIGLLVVGGLVAFQRMRATPERGRKFLVRWGIADPTLEQGAEAALYLRQRRRLYPLVFLALGVGIGAARSGGQPGGSWTLSLLAALLASLLLAEFVATVRPHREATRIATLVRRGVTDLVPRFAILLHVCLTLLAFAGVAIAFAGQPWADAAAAWRRRHDDEIGPNSPIGVEEWGAPPHDATPIWLLLIAVIVTAVAVIGIVWLALVRPPIAHDVAADAALRIRTARVAVGVGLVLTAALILAVNDVIAQVAGPAHQTVEGRSDVPLPAPDFPLASAWLPRLGDRYDALVVVAVLAGVLGWAAVINPWRNPRLVEASR